MVINNIDCRTPSLPSIKGDGATNFRELTIEYRRMREEKEDVQLGFDQGITPSRTRRIGLDGEQSTSDRD